MTRFPLLPVQPDKLALVCIVCLLLIGAMFMIARSPVEVAQPGSAPAEHAPAVAAPPIRSASSAQPAQAPRFTVKTVTGQSTFVDAANLAGLSATVAHRLIATLRSKIDFRHEWKEDNQVSFVFDTKNIPATAPAQHVAMPAAVRVVTDSGKHDIFLYKNLNGKAFYYTKDGSRARGGGFMRYPLQFRRVSSSFSLHRFDPVLKRWQPHDGVDLAAPAGTPVRATGNGIVTFAGTQAGYGNVIEIRNRPPYSTLFAHLSRFAKGIRAGAHVRRNEVIGYVGATGWATGPHLHYEVHVDDVPKNPLTVALPAAKPLSGPELSRFASRTAALEGLL
jgi:murein DD-endopeptidase MepM/ murein hydrolase activator NlpD